MVPFPVRAVAALAMSALLLPASTYAATHVVEVIGGAFVPAILTLTTGDTLRVINREGVPHTFTAVDGSYDSVRLMQGDATQIVLTTIGTHDFRCSLGGQTVRVLVEGSRGAAHRGGG